MQRPFDRSVEQIDAALEGRDYLVGDFFAAGSMLGHSLFMAKRLGQVSDELKHFQACVGRIEKRPAYEKAITMQ